MRDRLFTKAFIEDGIAVCNADKAHLSRAVLLTGRVVLHALHTPDETDVQVSYLFERGRCTSFDFVEAPAPARFRQDAFRWPSDGLVRVTATYETWVKLDKGDISPADAISLPDYEIDGNLLMLAPLMQAITSWTERVRQLPKAY